MPRCSRAACALAPPASRSNGSGLPSNRSNMGADAAPVVVGSAAESRQDGRPGPGGSLDRGWVSDTRWPDSCGQVVATVWDAGF
jgi:hypothetical protein